MKLLDCTLRDGGYVNGWNFGKDTIDDILAKLVSSGMDIVELGFLRDVVYSNEKTLFPSMEYATRLIEKCADKCEFAVMAEAAHQIDTAKLETCTADAPKLVRVIVWKTMHDSNGKESDALLHGYEYCERFVEKGYRLCVQPARVEQYNDEEFLAMLDIFTKLNPYAIYVVDSWGTLFSDEVVHYMNLADNALPQDIKLGYHGHNNMMQAFSTAERISNMQYKHELILDASVYGMGRGAGNLNTELIAHYLNHSFQKKYDVNTLINIKEKYIDDIYERTPWGYSTPYLCTAIHHANPNYGQYYSYNKKLNTENINLILAGMSELDKVLYDKELAEKHYASYVG